MKRNSKTLRTIAALAIVAIVFVGFLTNLGIGTISAPGIWDISILCPLGALGTMLASKMMVPRAMVSLAIMVALIIVFARAFCGWMCPVPLVQKLRGVFTKPEKQTKTKSPVDGKPVKTAAADIAPLTEDEKAATLPLLTDSILRIVEQAAKIDACFALEPVFVHTLGTVEKLRTLKEAVADHDHFHIIFDPVNVLTAADVPRQAAFWPAWCEVIGKDLACVHMKDAVFHPDAPRTPTALGAGQMDYTVIREWLHRDHPDAALLRDEVILPAAQADLAYIKAL